MIKLFNKLKILTLAVLFTPAVGVASPILYTVEGDLSGVDAISTPVGDLHNLSGAHFIWNIYTDTEQTPYNTSMVFGAPTARFDSWTKSNVTFTNRPNGATDLTSNVEFYGADSLFTVNSETGSDLFRIQEGVVSELASPYTNPELADFRMGILIAEFEANFFSGIDWAPLPGPFTSDAVTGFQTLSNGSDFFSFQIGNTGANNGPVYFAENLTLSAIQTIPVISTFWLSLAGFFCLISISNSRKPHSV